MASVDIPIIDLEATANAAKRLKMTFESDFFQSLDQKEILGGSISVDLDVKKTAGGFFALHYTVRGTVDVICDRCLDTLTLEVDTEEDVKVFFEEPSAAYDGEDYKLLPPRSNRYDIGWDIYEAAELALPLRRVHRDGECNAEMESRLSGLAAIESDEI